MGNSQTRYNTMIFDPERIEVQKDGWVFIGFISHRRIFGARFSKPVTKDIVMSYFNGQAQCFARDNGTLLLDECELRLPNRETLYDYIVNKLRQSEYSKEVEDFSDAEL